MRILIYGAGIQGSYLAHVLAKKKENHVTMLARNQRLAQLRAEGVVLQHQLQRKVTIDHLDYVEGLAATDHYDLIFVTMKYNDFETVLPILAANSSENIIFVGNQVDTAGLARGLTAQAAEPKNILFGFQTTGGTRKEKGMTILRFGKGKLKISASEELTKVAPLLEVAFAKTGYRWEADPQLDEWLKSHAALVAVLNSYDKLRHEAGLELSQKKLLKLTAASYGEAFAILTAAGHRIRPRLMGRVFSNIRLTTLLLRGIYATPIMSMQEGDFREIEAMLASLKKFQQDSETPAENFLHLARLAEGE